MSVCVCKDCKERNAECHANCKRYADWKAESEAARLNVYHKKQNEVDMAQYLINIKHRIKTGRFRK